MKRQKDEEGGQEWLNTYADMITLVLTFFVLLYSISNVNLTKLEEVASAMQRQLGIEAKTEIEDVPSDLKYPVVGEGAQAPLQQTQQQYQASAREMADMARDIQNTSFVLLIISAVVLMVIGEIWAGPILDFFGAGSENLVYAKSYFEIYLAGNIFAMLSGGMNPYITAQGFPRIGMMTIAIGAITNMVLDPLFIFVFHMGVAGAAVATVISQFLSAAYSWHFFHSRDNGYPLYGLRKNGRGVYLPYTGDIISLGTVPFIMQTTNSMVLVAANQMLSHLGGALDITIMTIASSVRQILDIPALSIADGTAPLISYNYGAGHLDIMRKAIRIMTAGTFLYTLTGWLCIEGFPHFFAGIFSNDANLIEKAVPALHIFCIAFIFQSLQMSGQTVFRSLGMKKQAIFFSLFRKVILVIPLTYILPYVGHLGKMGVLWAEPVSNVLGGVCCYTTMYFIMHRKLKQMEKQGKYL